ncbi:hypothetical protein [Singulisphaera sp. GP187]|uniref:hypothetical protein n=1 Tax=Singulisphaera sp. GP187 TaxID=1882752 RepID=UPI000941491A|nr:hypothetical protein [Singulisphaera sp. GP187]
MTVVTAYLTILALVPMAWGQMPTPVINQPQVPADVSIPGGSPGNPIAFFDDYSWRAFIAVVWPALKNQRGKPDPSQTVDGAGPRVFETYKSLAEVFHSDGSAPTAWNQFDSPQYNPCGVTESWGDLTLGSFSKFSNLGQAGFGTLVGPLLVQNTTSVRFQTAYNETEFNQIRNQKWYLRSNLPTPPATVTFDDGALDVKAAWIDMTNIPHPERYYTRTASMLDPVSGQCATTKVGLVGLHIVQKTPSRPQWIWTTFEHVDNVPPAQPGAPGTFTFNDGTSSPMPATNPYSLSQVLLAPTPPPFNVTRVKPIHDSTQTTNAAYHAALPPDSVWRYYDLVMTQWPLQPNSPTTPGTAPNTFPGLPAPNNTTAFANTTLETFEQGSVFTGCMACHNATMKPTDFVWSLNDHAFPASSSTPNLLMNNPAFRALRDTLQQSKNLNEREAAAKRQQP